MTTADVILGGIAEPGRTLAFCDETDLTVGPTSTMVAKIHAWVAMIVPSEAYAALRDALLAYQAEHGVPEFHGTEIVNPGSRSAWKPIAYERRLDAYRFACGLVTTHAVELRHVHISAEQYAAWLATRPEGLPKSYRDGVKVAFTRLLVGYLAGHAPAMVVFDKVKNSPGATLERVVGANHLAGGGILRASSDSLPGLQVADIAAYATGRFLKQRDKIMAGAANAFDKVSMEMLAALSGRVGSLLG